MSNTLVIARHCAVSLASNFKKRPEWFLKERCFNSVTKECDLTKNCELVVVFDEKFGSVKGHFVENQANIHIINEGLEARAFLAVLDFIESKDLADDDIVYIVEDDYLHLPGWMKTLQEGIRLTDAIKPYGGYVTLYDHFDKYTSMYKNLSTQLFITPSSHWRVTPSTTNTYAFRYKTLKLSMDLHRFYSEGVDITHDHEKFLTLSDYNQILISCIPGKSTHVENNLLSPCIDWSKV